jgi:chromosome segregation protein
VSAPARLLSVRLQGFKSFAERTHVTFGPGISAIVGPNGSGKSNLADALRWALGEQGRALRSRKAEDVIWAGSERRPALGMADVQLTLDNADGLLPVEYGAVELGRRLFRSGENDYLLNRQRVRLRDLVDLLDGANLSENAFLFIGQGMVDQALALRPEERRPLFEEVAGVRRPERRRRRAEEQLAEAETNLARLEDILGELRPQARRLAQQAEQVASRRSAADELAEAILAAAHARWYAGASRVAEAGSAAERARAAVDRAMAELAEHERESAELADRLAGRALAETERRNAVDAARAELTTLRLREGRLQAEADGLARERTRIDTERRSADADVAAARNALAVPLPPAAEPDEDIGEIEAQLAHAREELLATGSPRATGADAAALRRLAAVRAAEAEAARRRADDAERIAREERARATAEAARASETASRRSEIEAQLAEARAAETAARQTREAAQARLAELEAAGRAAGDAAAGARAARSAAEARESDARQQLEAEDADAFRVAARAGGGRPLDRELVVEAGLAAAVDAALAELGRAVVLERRSILPLLGERGLAIVAESLDRPPGVAESPAVVAFVAEVRARGGGLLVEAIRRDGSGAARRLLGQAAWLPDAAGCLELQALMPAGWIAVASDGGIVVRGLTASIRPDGGTLRRRADLERLATEALQAREVASLAEAEESAAATRVESARAEVVAAREAETLAASARHRFEEDERGAAGSAATTAREASWHAAQAERLESEAARLRAVAVEREAAIPRLDAGDRGEQSGEQSGERQRALEALEARIRELRGRRDELAAHVAAMATTRAEAERTRTRAEASLALAERRLTDLAAATGSLAEREAAVAAERETLTAALAQAARGVTNSEASLAEVLGQDADDRERLRAAEAAAAAARHAARSAEDASRAVEREELEARLALEGLREQLLVELAGLGALGLRHLAGGSTAEETATPQGSTTTDAPTTGAPTTPDGPTPSPSDDVDPEALEAALVAAARAWESLPPAASPPTPGRLAALRRRFHELGAGNPFAVAEYAEVRARLENLEAQRRDLLAAVDQTRTLIGELDRLIGDQFRTTFAALERAFDDRFRQLFGGGFARLSLTDPDDLASTGVEIVARPPGKKPQALAMLSGGERALTAVALLFAMLEVRPVPFCVLDEVDAALDEANIGRFTEALRELATATQCIVITHNRGTIETADALYGVTVGDDSVSRVISLRLDEATELAGRREAGSVVASANGDRADAPLGVGG